MRHACAPRLCSMLNTRIEKLTQAQLCSSLSLHPPRTRKLSGQGSSAGARARQQQPPAQAWRASREGGFREVLLSKAVSSANCGDNHGPKQGASAYAEASDCLRRGPERGPGDIGGLCHQCFRVWLSGAPQAASPANCSPFSQAVWRPLQPLGTGKDCAQQEGGRTDSAHLCRLLTPSTVPTGKQGGPLPWTPSGQTLLSLSMVRMHPQHPQHPWHLSQQVRVRFKTMTQEFPHPLSLCIYLPVHRLPFYFPILSFLITLHYPSSASSPHIHLSFCSSYGSPPWDVPLYSGMIDTFQVCK